MAYVFPGYITEYNFNQEKLDEIFKSATIDNDIDQFNNLILSSDVSDPTDLDKPEKFLILVETKRMNYDPAAIETFADPTFTEFTEEAASTDDPTTTYDSIESDMANQLQQENILQAQIDELSSVIETEADKHTKSQEDAEMNYRASKELIIQQRIKAGEGKTSVDFSDAFPFLPLTEEQKREGETGIEKSAMMRSPREKYYH